MTIRRRRPSLLKISIPCGLLALSLLPTGSFHAQPLMVVARALVGTSSARALTGTASARALTGTASARILTSTSSVGTRSFMARSATSQLSGIGLRATTDLVPVAGGLIAGAAAARGYMYDFEGDSWGLDSSSRLQRDLLRISSTDSFALGLDAGMDPDFLNRLSEVQRFLASEIHDAKQDAQTWKELTSRFPEHRYVFEMIGRLLPSSSRRSYDLLGTGIREKSYGGPDPVQMLIISGDSSKIVQFFQERNVFGEKRKALEEEKRKALEEEKRKALEEEEKVREEKKAREEGWREWMKLSASHYQERWPAFLDSEEVLDEDRLEAAFRKAMRLGVFRGNNHGIQALGFVLWETGRWNVEELYPREGKRDAQAWGARWRKAFRSEDDQNRRMLSGLALRLERVVHEVTEKGSDLKSTVDRELNPVYVPPPPSAEPEAITQLFENARDSSAGIEPLARAQSAEQRLRRQLGASIFGPGLKDHVDHPETADTLSRWALGLGAALGASPSWSEARAVTEKWLAQRFGLPAKEAQVRLRALVECGVFSPGLLP